MIDRARKGILICIEEGGYKMENIKRVVSNKKFILGVTLVILSGIVACFATFVYSHGIKTIRKGMTDIREYKEFKTNEMQAVHYKVTGKKYVSISDAPQLIFSNVNAYIDKLSINLSENESGSYIYKMCYNE